MVPTGLIFGKIPSTAAVAALNQKLTISGVYG
jgi:hypothetical protein